MKKKLLGRAIRFLILSSQHLKDSDDFPLLSNERITQSESYVESHHYEIHRENKTANGRAFVIALRFQH